MRNRIAAILVLLGLLTGLGDYPFADEFFAAQRDCATFTMPAGPHPSGHHRHAVERAALCYTALASAIANSTPVIDLPPAHGPRIADDGMQPAIRHTRDRIERPPTHALAG